MAMDLKRFPAVVQTVPYIAPNVRIYYPRVVGMQNQRVQEKINQSIVAQVQQLIAEQLKVQIQGRTEMYGFYELKTNERGVLSLTQVNYAYTPPMAHGMTFVKSLTFDLGAGKAYSLSELFKPGSPYVQTVSENIRVQIEERDLPLLGPFKGIRPDQDYYIADKALVVYFQLYEIAPYYAGFPMFPISVYELREMINGNSPLGKMLPAI